MSWVLQEPNCRFIEILPEATLRMGLGLKSSMLTRPAFAILVSEHALSIISRECGNPGADNMGTNLFGRVREDIDEDTVSAVQAAAYSFISRIQAVLTELCDHRVAWFDKLPEYQKINRIVSWANNSSIGEHEKTLILANASALKRGLAHLVRGRIFWCYSRQMFVDQNNEANDHRRGETYLGQYKSDFCRDIYSPMAEKEKMVTRYPWNSLRDLPFDVASNTRVLFDETGIDADIAIENRKIAERHGLQEVHMFDLTKFQFRLNREIMAAVQAHGFNFGLLPAECFHQIALSEDDENSSEDGEDDNWSLPKTTYSPQATSKSSGSDFQEPVKARKRSDMLEKLEPVSSSASSTRGVLNFPLRPKHSTHADVVPLLENGAFPSGPLGPSGAESAESVSADGILSSMISQTTNIPNTSTAFLSTQQNLTGSQKAAINFYNQSTSSTSTGPSFSSLAPGSPVPPKNRKTPNQVCQTLRASDS